MTPVLTGMLSGQRNEEIFVWTPVFVPIRTDMAATKWGAHSLRARKTQENISLHVMEVFVLLARSFHTL